MTQLNLPHTGFILLSCLSNGYFLSITYTITIAYGKKFFMIRWSVKIDLFSYSRKISWEGVKIAKSNGNWHDIFEFATAMKKRICDLNCLSLQKAQLQ